MNNDDSRTPAQYPGHDPAGHHTATPGSRPSAGFSGRYASTGPTGPDSGAAYGPTAPTGPTGPTGGGPRGSGGSGDARRSRRAVTALVVLGVLAIGGIATSVALALGNHTSSTAAHTTTAHTTTAAIIPLTTDTAPVTPLVPAGTTSPSAAVEMLQRDLGQLNYYEGPINGVMTPQTHQAIEYLQRDAHLPQTGQLNTATVNALNYFLAHGNNNMGS